MIRGAIFHNPQFRFHDGEIGNKLLVLLNTPSDKESCLFVKTTSQKKDKPSTIGCFKHNYTGLYFIQKGTQTFKKDTWVILFKPYEIRPCDVNLKNGWKKIGSLSANTMKQIIDCLFTHHEDDISELHEVWLKPPITASIHKLKEKFNSKRN